MIEIITDYEKLSERAEEIDVAKQGALVREIILALKEVVREKNLSSLSAPQIGYNKRIFVINFKGDIRSFINPTIVKATGIELSKENCSSIPDKKYIRIRNNTIEVFYQTPLGKIETKKFIGLAATVYQHELDHLDGLLISDVGLEIDEDYENATEEEKTQIINMYLDSLDVKRKQVTEEVNKDTELKQMSDAIDFLEKLQKGEVQLSDPVSRTKSSNGENKNQTE